MSEYSELKKGVKDVLLRIIPILCRYLKDKFIVEVDQRLTKKAFDGCRYTYATGIQTSDYKGKLYNVKMIIEIEVD